MARVVDSPPRGPNNRYPWDQWADGQIWEARQGEDFDVSLKSFRQYIVVWAARHGRHATTEVVQPDTVKFQII